MSAWTTLEAAAASIPDGALLSFGGFQLNRAPMALVMEIVRQRKRRLRVVSVPNALPLDLLTGAGLVAEAEFGFLGFQYEGGFVVAPNVRRAIERGTIAWRERDVYEIVQGLRAAALGLPFLPAPGAEGSDYARANRTPTVRDPGTGEEILVAPAVRPDVTLLHAQEADREGNLAIDDPYADDLLARASARVIATVETIVGRIERPTIPGGRVTMLTEVHLGAFPTSCHGHYGWSKAHLGAYLALASEGRTGDYLDRYVGAGRPAFLEAVARDADRPEVGRDTIGPERAAAVDRLVVGMARAIDDGDVVTTGVASALPMLAVALAKATRARGATYINCVGAVDPPLASAAWSSVDPRLLDGCRDRVTLPQLFDIARRGGIDLMYFGAAQVDAEGRLNLTCIGDYARPKVKLPGPAGSSAMRPFVRKVVVLLSRHSTQSLVPRVDFATSVPSQMNAATTVVTDLAILRLQGGRLRLVSRHAGVAPEALQAATGFPLEGDLKATTAEPTGEEREALHRLDPEGIRHRLA